MRAIYLQPGFSESDFTDLMASRVFVYADCYTIVLASGSTALYTSAQYDTTVQANVDTGVPATYLANDILIEGLKFRIGIGVDVDEQQITLKYNPATEAPIGGQTMAQSLHRGAYDGAKIVKDRYYASDWGQPWIAGVRLFSGRVGSISSIGRTEASMTVRSDLALLNIDMPRNVFQEICNHTLFDSGCGLAKAAYAVTGTVGAGSTRSKINWGSAIRTPPLDLGTVTIANATAAQYIRTIRKATATGLELAYPLDFDPIVGSAFTAYPGCPRTYASCQTFGNTSKYKGFPYVPVIESAY